MGVDGGLPAVEGDGFGRLGSVGVRDAVGRWLWLVEADTELRPFLVGVDRARLAGHLALLLTAALGGPAGDVARPCTGAWQGLGMSEGQRRRAVNYLVGTLQAMGVPAADADRAGQTFTEETVG
ncbi:globin [Micromonospora sp. NPDC003197]